MPDDWREPEVWIIILAILCATAVCFKVVSCAETLPNERAEQLGIEQLVPR